MPDLEGQRDFVEKDSLSPEGLPVWRKPAVAVLDVESGTLTTTGPFPDGNGSTS